MPPGDLPGVVDPGALSVAHQGQPHDTDRGDFPLCLSGGRDDQPSDLVYSFVFMVVVVILARWCSTVLKLHLWIRYEPTCYFC